MESKENIESEECGLSSEAVVRYDNWNNVSFMTNGGEIKVSVVDGEMTIFCDGILKITPISITTVKLGVEKSI